MVTRATLDHSAEDREGNTGSPDPCAPVVHPPVMYVQLEARKSSVVGIDTPANPNLSTVQASWRPTVISDASNRTVGSPIRTRYLLNARAKDASGGDAFYFTIRRLRVNPLIGTGRTRPSAARA
jgi:hypothetical protein